MTVLKKINLSIREKRYKRIDLIVTIALMLLLISSCIMVYSSSVIGNKYGMFTNFVPVAPDYFFKRQVIWSVVSLIAYFIFATIIPFEVFKEKKLFLWGSIIIMILLIIPQFQGSLNGARSWLRVFGFSFQPSALAQIYIILYMSLITRKRKLMKPTTLENMSKIFILPLILLALIFVQNDTGTMLITTFVMVIMILCANIHFKNIIMLAKFVVISLILLGIFYYITTFFSNGESSYRANRFKVFFDPFNGISDSNNQVVNSLIAFGNGGVLGRGIGNSVQKLGYLSEAHTDFILAITAEEFGFLGIITITILLFTIILKVLRTAFIAKDTFASLFSIGFSSLLTVQTIVNMGGITASLPMTGVPVPYYSYGGTSLLILSITLGIIMNLSAHIKYKKGSF